MDTKEELKSRIDLLQKQIKECVDDAQAILMQKQLIDLLRLSFKNKEFLADLVSSQQQKK